MKGYRISSRFRFIAFVTMSIILFTLMFNLIFAISTAQSETIYDPIYISVESGDTLWSIAETYMPDTDTREAVYMISELNDLNSGNISVGMTLEIPA